MEATEVAVELFRSPPVDLFQCRAIDHDGEASTHMPKTIMMVKHSDTLGEILDRAADALGLQFTAEAREMYLKYRGGDLPAVSSVSACFGLASTGSEEPHLMDTVTVLDDQGRAVWGTRFDRVTYKELLNSVEAGLVEGDPRLLYLHPWPPGGGIGPESWKDFLDALDLIFQVYAIPGALWATNDLVGRLRRRLKRSRQAVEQQAVGLAERGARPEDVTALLERRRWTLGQTARLLGTDEQGAISWLKLLGFRPEDDGYWYAGSDAVSEMTRGDVQLALTDPWLILGTSGPVDEDKWGEIINARRVILATERVAYLVEHAAAPPPPDDSELVQRWSPPN
jgi:hypothetical protein